MCVDVKKNAVFVVVFRRGTRSRSGCRRLIAEVMIAFLTVTRLCCWYTRHLKRSMEIGSRFSSATEDIPLFFSCVVVVGERRGIFLLTPGKARVPRLFCPGRGGSDRTEQGKDGKFPLGRTKLGVSGFGRERRFFGEIAEVLCFGHV